MPRPVKLAAEKNAVAAWACKLVALTKLNDWRANVDCETKLAAIESDRSRDMLTSSDVCECRDSRVRNEGARRRSPLVKPPEIRF